MLQRVLVVDEELPWPANTGKRLRTLNLLASLSKSFRIDLLVHSNGATPEARAALEARGVTVHVAPSRIPGRSGAGFPLRLAASLVRGLPYSVYSHHQPAYAAALEDLLRRTPYDLLHFEWTPYAVYATPAGLPTCVAAHNVEWEIWSRTAATERRLLHRQLFEAQTRLMRRFEAGVFARIGHATAVSTADAARISEMGCRHVTVVPNGVDATLFQPQASASQAPRSLVFSGSMDWRANQDAIHWFIEAVHPLLMAQGDYELQVVGRAPPPWLQDRARVPRQVVVTGAVDQVQPFIAAAAVYVVPLRVGGGSRLKILEALAMGKAVVSTTVGAEGLDVGPGVDIMIADGAAEFAATIEALWADGPTRQRLGEAGRALIERQYRWEQIAPLQATAWHQAIAG
jgi:glycosyltransferase involved in cell wall biosynthesis